MVLAVFGINYKRTKLETLEHIAFSAEDVANALARVATSTEMAEAVIVSTCNRLEWYVVGREEGRLPACLQESLRTIKPACTAEIFANFYYKEGTAAIEHLFAVASGLDSLVIGENEIAGQLKAAYTKACQVKTTGILLNKLFHAAFRTSKRVKNETKINEGNCSVGCVAVDLAEQMFPNLPQCQVLLIGAGEIIQVVAKTLKKRQAQNLWLANRSVEKAQQLASEVGGRALPLDGIAEVIPQMDVIISGTGAQDYLFTANDLRRLLAAPRATPLLIVDIALPRDFDPAIKTLPNVRLKNLYDLHEVVNLNLQKRAAEVPQVEKIIAEEVQKFLSWQEALGIKPIIQALTENFETLRRAEFEKQRPLFPAETLAQVEYLTKALTNKYIHLIVSNSKTLHEVCRLTPEHVHIIEQLFQNQGNFDEQTRCRFKRQQSCAETDATGDGSPQGGVSGADA